ncbi:MAG: glutamate--cysteine ligase [Actinobacteria bacterium]|nr:glutamate--cysteine ligase [Actinomycetota bacterium]
MGRDIDQTEFSREDRVRYRDKVKVNLSALEQLMREGRFETGRRLCGVECEVYITDQRGDPAPINAKLLEKIASDEFQTELAQFNIEFGNQPRRLADHVFHAMEVELRRSLNHAHAMAEHLDARVVIIGILPTLTDFDITEQNLSANPRYKALNDMILGQRGEDIHIRIEGDETFETMTDSILFEAACTSVQLHLQVDPKDFALYWNTAQALSAPLVAVGANSPFLLGKQLHHETRIALFEQSIDTRTEELAQQGVRPRVWFGERWLTEGLFELFDENVRYFPSLLPLCDLEDPHEMIAEGKAPRLPELMLHNGTIWRWNRPVYEVNRGRPHMRVENRVLPAGPSVPDIVANAAFYYGLLRGLASRDRKIWTQMSFDAARDNFFAAARDGLTAELYWPGAGAHVPVTELIVRRLLSIAEEGLRDWQVNDSDIDYYLGIIEERVLSGQNGATWQIAAWRSLRESGLDDHEAFRELVSHYHSRSFAGSPVHTWTLP